MKRGYLNNDIKGGEAEFKSDINILGLNHKLTYGKLIINISSFICQDVTLSNNEKKCIVFLHTIRFCY